MKQPNWKTPLILSATLLLVGTFAYWLQYSHKPKKDKADILTKKPIALASEDTQVALIKIKSSQGLIELKCNSVKEKKCTGGTLGKWSISHPLNPQGEAYEADSSTVKEFLNSATNAIATEVIEIGDESAEKKKTLFSQYGLSDDQRTKAETQFLELITADDQGKPGKRLTAWFGEEHPIGDKTFVASAVDGILNDKTVFLLSNQFKSSNFTKTVTSFREKSLFTFDRQNITEFSAKVTAEKKNGGKLVGKKTNSMWAINGYPANFDHIETVLSGIANAKATDFVDMSLIKGLKPIVTYDLKAADQSYSLSLYEKTLPEKKIGNEKIAAEKHYYAQSSQQKELMEVEAILRSNIDKALTDLRDTIILRQTEKVTATHFKVEETGFSASPEYHYSGGQWTAVDPSKKWEVSLVPKLIDIFAITRIKDFVSPPPAGKELFKIAIGDEKNPEKFHYSFFTANKSLYARNLNEKNNEAYLMEDSMKPALPKTENEWKIKAPEPTK